MAEKPWFRFTLLLLEALPNPGRLSWVTIFLVSGALQYNRADKVPPMHPAPFNVLYVC